MAADFADLPRMPGERVQTLIVGGGQAGLTMSHRLKQRGLAHLVLERHRIAERWRSERWDGLRFQFPNWSVALPDFPFPHADPDAFAASGDILDYVSAYAAFVAPPIRCGVAVTALRRGDRGAGFVAETSDGPIEAANVVVATGPYQRAILPAALSDGIGAFQVHASNDTRTRSSCRPARCWWSVRGLRARKLPKSCFAPAAASISRSAATPGCRDAIVDAI